jgi:hypothetical protein
MQNEEDRQQHIEPNVTEDNSEDGFMFSDGENLNVTVIDTVHGLGDHTAPTTGGRCAAVLDESERSK